LNDETVWEKLYLASLNADAVTIYQIKIVLFDLLRIGHAEANRYLSLEKAPYWTQLKRVLKKRF